MGEQINEDDVDEMIASADKNGDGKIDFDEFVAANSQFV